METLKLSGKAENGKMLIAIPTEMSDMLLEILFTPVDEKASDEDVFKKAQARGQALSARFGKAPH